MGLPPLARVRIPLMDHNAISNCYTCISTATNGSVGEYMAATVVFVVAFDREGYIPSKRRTFR